MEVRGARALVTGASGGLGQAIARRLASLGAEVVVTGRRADELEALARSIGGRAMAVDLSSREGVSKLVSGAGQVDILVANAGVPASGSLLDMTEKQADIAVDVNFRAPMQLARALGGDMAARRAGHIVFVSSMSGKVSVATTAVYSATKFALRGLAIGLRADLAAKGVGVSVVCPGFIREAGMFARSGGKVPAGLGTRSPEDVAEGVVRCIERNLDEVDVAPSIQRLGGVIGLLAPDFVNRVSRLPMGERIAGDLARRQSEIW